MSVGIIFEEAGLLKKHDRFKLVKKVGKQGELIAKHNHPEALVVFTCVKGEVKVYLNDDEVHIVEPGKVLHFDGDNYINAEFLQDGEVFVTEDGAETDLDLGHYERFINEWIPKENEYFRKMKIKENCLQIKM